MRLVCMSWAAFVVALGLFAPFFCQPIESVSAAPPHSMPHAHRAELVLLEVSMPEDRCIDTEPISISHEPGIRLVGSVTGWRWPGSVIAPHTPVVQVLPVL